MQEAAAVHWQGSLEVTKPCEKAELCILLAHILQTLKTRRSARAQSILNQLLVVSLSPRSSPRTVLSMQSPGRFHPSIPVCAKVKLLLLPQKGQGSAALPS